MSAEEANPELTTTLHLGLRSVVGDSPSSALTQFTNEASDEVAQIISQTLAGDGRSAMVFIHRGPSKGARFLIPSGGVTIGRAPESEIFLTTLPCLENMPLLEK